jgi:hypothetical protein
VDLPFNTDLFFLVSVPAELWLDISKRGFGTGLAVSTTACQCTAAALVLLPLAPLLVCLTVRIPRRIQPTMYQRFEYWGMFLTGSKVVWDGLHGVQSGFKTAGNYWSENGVKHGFFIAMSQHAFTMRACTNFTSKF